MKVARATRVGVLAVAVVVGCGGSQLAGDGDEPDARADGSGDASTEGSGDGLADGGDGAGDVRPEVPDVPATCGNGVLDPGEECDDGNRLNGDDCDWACHAGSGTVPPFGSEDPDVDDFASGDALQPVDLSDIAVESVAPPLVATLAWGETVYATLIGAGVTVPGDPESAPTTAFLRFGADGRRVGPAWRYLDENSPRGYLDLVWNGDGYGLAWCGPGAALWFVELDRDGKPLYPPLQPVAVDDLCDPTIVWDGERYGLLWTLLGPDQWLGGEDLRFVALGHRGVTVTEVVVVHHNPAGGIRLPDASTSGATVLVAFSDNPGRCGGATESGCQSVATVSRDGVVVHAPVMVTAGGRAAPDTAWGDDRFGVLVDSLDSYGLHLAMFAETGELLGAPIPIRTLGLVPVTGAGTGTALAWGRGGWAVAYLNGDRMAGFEPASGVIRLDGDGGFVNVVPAGMDGCRSGGGANDRAVDMAFDGRGFGLLCFMDSGIAFGRFPLEP
jgi:cysteine-rich repeat protein